MLELFLRTNSWLRRIAKVTLPNSESGEKVSEDDSALSKVLAALGIVKVDSDKALSAVHDIKQAAEAADKVTHASEQTSECVHEDVLVERRGSEPSACSLLPLAKAVTDSQ
jgi:hypothetical protein